MLTLSPLTVNLMELARSLALIDANLNRCREGLRVLDDLARFLISASELCEQIKRARHQLVAAEAVLRKSVPDLLKYRDVAADPGTAISVDNELTRTDIRRIASANVRRVQEALRSLEEFGKLHSSAFAHEVKQLRYRSYDLEQQLTTAIDCLNTTGQDLRQSRQQKLHQADIYVLVTESLCRRPWQETVAACAARASLIQLREKDASTRVLLQKARWLCDVCRETGCLAVINDRPDIARLCAADGIHLGQDDASVEDARSIVGPQCLIGVSTHNPDQLGDAHLEAADYFGVGPVFTSGTKDFDNYAGISYVAAASAAAQRPWFPIGGITRRNLPEVISAGARRVAVCGEVIGSDDPGERISELRAILAAADAESQRCDN